jgi:hypothetical protein
MTAAGARALEAKHNARHSENVCVLRLIDFALLTLESFNPDFFVVKRSLSHPPPRRLVQRFSLDREMTCRSVVTSVLAVLLQGTGTDLRFEID